MFHTLERKTVKKGMFVCFTLMLILGMAVPSAAAATPDRVITHCDVMLGPVDPATGFNVIKSQHCQKMTNHDRDVMLAARMSKSSPAPTASASVTPNSSIVLIIIFQDTSRSGNSSAISASSECDTAGFHFEPSSFWQKNISSLGQGNASCDRALLTNYAQTSSATYVVPTDGISGYDNNINHMQVYR